MSAEARRAYNSWRDQRHRCENPNIECYKYYGGRGIKVEYCAREFVGWWLEEIKHFTGSRPTISRIDHDKDYAFGNIKLEDHKKNCVEDVLKRCGAPGVKCRKPIVCIDLKTGKRTQYASAVEASVETGVKRSNIASLCVGFKPNGHKYVQTLSGLTFRYAEGFERKPRRAA